VPQYPAQYVGKFFYGDFCQGYVRSLDPVTYETEPFVEYATRPVALAVSPDGFLYRLEYDSGSLARVRYAAEVAPTIQAQPADLSVAVGQVATFGVRASGSQPLSYQWLRDGVEIVDATAATLTLTAAASDDGASFQVRVGNAFGSILSDAATLSVAQDNAPVVELLSPESGALFSAGDTIAYAATARDEEDGELAPHAFTWEVVLHHDQHTHPFIAPYSGSTSGTFEIPRVGHTETNVFYRVQLRVVDSSGLVSAAYRDVSPRLTTLHLLTDPPGLTVSFDGTPMSTPAAVLSVVGITHILGVLDPQTLGGSTYTFSGWSDGGAATHAIDAPAADTEYVALFQQSECPAEVEAR
jgi:hypothetical protein